ncbi:hypothetical protein CaCOL14_002092 [Colletotrichum acutatum]
MSKDGLSRSRSIKNVSTPTQQYCYPYHCHITHTSYCIGSSSVDSYNPNSIPQGVSSLPAPSSSVPYHQEMRCLYQSLHAPDRTLTGTEPPT